MSANIVIADSAVPTLKSGKSLLLLVSIVLAPAPAKAAGFDLHGAKQSAMGGAAIAYTDDTRALIFGVHPVRERIRSRLIGCCGRRQRQHSHQHARSCADARHIPEWSLVAINALSGSCARRHNIQYREIGL